MRHLQNLLLTLKQQIKNDTSTPIIKDGLISKYILTKYPLFKCAIEIEYFWDHYKITKYENGEIVFEASIKVDKHSNLAQLLVVDIYSLIYIKQSN